MSRFNPNILSLLLLVVIFSGCQKELKEPVTEPATCLISKAIFSPETGDNGYTTLDYDNQNRVVKITYFEHLNDSLYLTRATYENNKITVIEGEVGPSYTNDTIVYTLTNGKISSGVKSRTENSGSFTITEKTEYLYERNASGYITKITETSRVTSTYPFYTPTTETRTYVYTYQNGNVISMIYTSDYDTYTETYEYFTDKLNILASYNESSFDHLTQPHASNLIKKTTTTEGGIVQNVEEISYTFDAQGKVIKSKTTNTGAMEENDVYEYKCD